jgi:glycosyltransferase involved in cell wall biosynthesis
VKDMGWRREIAVISNFTEARKAVPVERASLDTPEGAFVISSMGRFVPRKGFDVLVRALARLPNAYLWLLGNGEEEANLKALAAELGVADRLRLAGWQADPGPFVAASDCFAMASSHEPLGNVVLEAWAQGVPVVATRAEGPTWFMRDGENGLMVDIGDHEGMAAAIQRLMQEPGLACALATGGERALEERFSRKAITDAYMDILRRR